MWKRIKPYFDHCTLAFREEYKPITGYKPLRILAAIILFILGWVIADFLGVKLIDLVKPIYHLLSIQSWMMVALGIAILFLLSLIDGSRRYHERVASELSAEREAERIELLNHAVRMRRLSEVAGYAGEIDLHHSDDEIPANELNIWRGLLQTALQDCYGREGASKFYRRNDATEISPAQGYLWFRTHYQRLSDFITEQHQAQSLARKSVTLTPTR